MTEKNKMEKELFYGTSDIALSFFEAWQYCYSEYITFDEYIVRVMSYFKDHFGTIKEKIENADDEE